MRAVSIYLLRNLGNGCMSKLLLGEFPEEYVA